MNKAINDLFNELDRDEAEAWLKKKLDQLNRFAESLVESQLNTEVFCTLQFEAVHSWPNCNITEVDYLRLPHRHLFHIKAYKRVSHDDRDVEFIQLKHQIQRYLLKKYPDFDIGPQSCEMLAKELITAFKLSKCEVSEDNENGAIVTVD